jgi:hypothetical protein
MHPAKSFVLPAWSDAFESIEDWSPTLVAGTAMWVRVTRVVPKKKGVRRRTKSERVTTDPAQNAYYLVTDGGLHVAQAGGDHFVPRDQINGVARWEVGEGGVMAKVHVGEEGACVDIRFQGSALQFSGNTEAEISADTQRENAIRGLVDGVGPVIETATKTCPDCAEQVKYLANVCRFCGYRFDGTPQPRASMLRALRARLSERISDQARVVPVEEEPIEEEPATARGDLDEELSEQSQNGHYS